MAIGRGVLVYLLVSISQVTAVPADLTNYDVFPGKKVSTSAHAYSLPVQDCANIAEAMAAPYFQYNPTTSRCQTLSSNDDMHSDQQWIIYSKKQKQAEEKKSFCLVVALDKSDSIDDVEVTETHGFLDELMSAISNGIDVNEFVMSVTLVPFSDGVVRTEVRSIRRNPRLLLGGVLQISGSTIDSMRSAGTAGLTDISSALTYIDSIECSADKKVIFVVSDFINTKRTSAIKDSVKVLTENGNRVVPVALTKAFQPIVKKVKEENGPSLDLSTDYAASLSSIFDDL